MDELLAPDDEFDRGESLAAGPYYSAMGELCDQYIARHEFVWAIWCLLSVLEIRILCAPRFFVLFKKIVMSDAGWVMRLRKAAEFVWPPDFFCPVRHLR